MITFVKCRLLNDGAWIWFSLQFAVLLMLTGCLSSLAIKHVKSDYWIRQLTENALTTSHLSTRSSNYLSLRGWGSKELHNPETVLLELRSQLLKDPNRVGLIAFAELAYLSGKKSEFPERKFAYLLSAARASYAVVFDSEMGSLVDPLDPNLRFAADIYNYSLSQLVDAMLNKRKHSVEKDKLEMIEGILKIERGHGMEDAPDADQTIIAFSYKTNVLRQHNRQRGIGVPIVIIRSRENVIGAEGCLHPSIRESGIAPATLLLKFNDSWRKSDLSGAVVELWDTMNTTSVQIANRSVPIETDTSLSLAMIYEANDKYIGLLNMPRLLRGAFMEEKRGLYLLEPYNPKKIPLLFVHGLMDSPLTWIPMLNTLLSDPVIKKHYQIWIFFYPTMNPIIQSASELRQSLLALNSKMTAENTAWDDMVIIGHSMGGLITRLMITPSSETFGDMKRNALDVGEGDKELRDYIQQLLYFKPLPFVSTVIFIGVPHGGANMASRLVGRAGSAIMNHPAYMLEFLDGKEGRLERLNEIENGIDNLATDSMFTLALRESRWADGVRTHSIIGDRFRAGQTNGTDGVVAYWSSHVDDVDSELIVKADHLILHKKIPAIIRVRKILIEHLKE